MPGFVVVTNLPFENNDDVRKFIKKSTRVIAKTIRVPKEHVTLVMELSTKKGDTAQYKSYCEILCFKEITSAVKFSLNQAAFKIEHLLKEWFSIDQHIFTTSVLNHTDRVLLDWSQRDMFASTTVQDQGNTKFCWAYALADTVGISYAIINPHVKSSKEFRCSPQDLADWVYLVKKLKDKEKLIVEYGSYGCNPVPAIEYVAEQGVSLLNKYKIKTGKIDLKAYEDEGELEREFQAMRKEKGPRIFIKSFDVLYREAGTGIVSIDQVFKFLQKGVVYASMYYCKGCSACRGFSAFDGIGVYDEPSHAEDHEFARHGVMVIGVGNKDGKDYLTIRNSRGSRWPMGGARKGCGDVHIKFFVALFLMKGLEKKVFNRNEWVSIQE